MAALSGWSHVELIIKGVGKEGMEYKGGIRGGGIQERQVGHI